MIFAGVSDDHYYMSVLTIIRISFHGKRKPLLGRKGALIKSKLADTLRRFLGIFWYGIAGYSTQDYEENYSRNLSSLLLGVLPRGKDYYVVVYSLTLLNRVKRAVLLGKLCRLIFFTVCDLFFAVSLFVGP